MHPVPVTRTGRSIRGLVGRAVVPLFAFLALSALTLSACRGTSQEDACAAYAQAVCNLMNRCSPATLSLTFGNTDVCVERQQLGCSYQFPENSKTEPDHFVTCANALGNASCELGLNIPECRVMPGDRQNGMLCFSDVQCQSTFCNRSNSTTTPCGSCANRAQQNEICDTTVCEPEFVCATNMGIGPSRCVPPVLVGAGAMCGGANRCQSGLLCLGGTCTPLLKQGDTCNPLSSACDQTRGLYCDTTMMRCMSVQYVPSGQACGGAVSVPTQCAGSARCLNQGMNSVCVGPAQEGQRCGGTYGCMPPSSCINGLCLLPDPPFCE
jgi:hypothetical protein